MYTFVAIGISSYFPLFIHIVCSTSPNNTAAACTIHLDAVQQSGFISATQQGECTCDSVLLSDLEVPIQTYIGAGLEVAEATSQQGRGVGFFFVTQPILNEIDGTNLPFSRNQLADTTAEDALYAETVVREEHILVYGAVSQPRDCECVACRGRGTSPVDFGYSCTMQTIVGPCSSFNCDGVCSTGEQSEGDSGFKIGSHLFALQEVLAVLVLFGTS
jgi:hypothetical protein